MKALDSPVQVYTLLETGAGAGAGAGAVAGSETGTEAGAGGGGMDGMGGGGGGGGEGMGFADGEVAELAPLPCADPRGVGRGRETAHLLVFRLQRGGACQTLLATS